MKRFDGWRHLSLAVSLVVLVVIPVTAAQQPTSPPEAGPEDMDGRILAAVPMAPKAKLTKLGIELMEPPAPVANYVRAVRTGNLVYLAQIQMVAEVE